MSIFDALRRRTPGPRAAAPAEPDGHAELRGQRDELAAQVHELTWDLGGLAYEMAIRDHFRLDVLVRRAALLQDADGRLAEVQRLLSAAEDGLGGTCRSCGAPHSRGAAFCWRCGQPLMPEVGAAGPPPVDPSSQARSDEPTQSSPPWAPAGR